MFQRANPKFNLFLSTSTTEAESQCGAMAHKDAVGLQPFGIPDPPPVAGRPYTPERRPKLQDCKPLARSPPASLFPSDVIWGYKRAPLLVAWCLVLFVTAEVCTPQQRVMAVKRAKRVSAVWKCDNARALREYRHRVIEADKTRRAARKARDLEASKKAHAKRRRPRRDEKMALLFRLLDAMRFSCRRGFKI